MTAFERGHDRFRELAATAIDFALGAADAAELAAHLAGCAACARAAARLRLHAASLAVPAELATSYRLDTAIGGAIAGRRAQPFRRQTLVLVAATALLLGALLGAAAVGAFLLRSVQPPLVVNPSPSLPVVAVPSSTPRSGPDLAGLTWQLASIPPLVGDSAPDPVAAAGGEPGFVAVGGRVFSDNVTPAGGTASAWRSTDGLTWMPAPAGAGLALGNGIPVDDEPTPGIADVAWGPRGFVAVGIDIDSSGNRVGALWNSIDGVTWDRLRPKGSPAPPDDLVRIRPAAVAWDGSAYVLVGVIREKEAPRAAAWRSIDNGRAFFQVPDAGAFDIGGYVTLPSAMGSGGLADVTAAPDGSLVAVGSSCSATASMDGQSVCRPIVLRSSDGESWARVPGPNPSGVGLASVAAVGTRYVAIGGGPGNLRYVQATGPVGGDPATAQVAVGDASGWRLVEPAGVPRLQRVVAYSNKFLAVSGASNRISLWSSADGEAWTEVPGLPQPPLAAEWPADGEAFGDLDLIVAGGRVVIIGRNQGDPSGITAFSVVGSLPASEIATATPAPSPTPAPSATPSPASASLIAYGASDGGRPVVKLIRPDGSGATILAEGADPAWSPDGTRIAYSCYAAAIPAGRLGDVCAMNADGTAQHRLIDGGVLPRWSPNGRQLLFSRSVTDAGDTWMADADGSNARKLGDGTGSWSPDGGWIALVGASGASPDVTLVRPDGSGARKLGNCWHAAWHPDATRLACTRWDEVHGTVYAIDVASGRTTTLLETDGSILTLAWVDANSLALTMTRPHASAPPGDDVYLADDIADGTIRRLTTGLSVTGPIDVAADGRRLVFTMTGADSTVLFLLDTRSPGTTGGDVRPVATDATSSAPRWQPVGGKTPSAPPTPVPSSTPATPATLPPGSAAPGAPSSPTATTSAGVCPGDTEVRAKFPCVVADLTWRPAAGSAAVYRIYETSSGEGADAACRPAEGHLILATPSGATTARVGPFEPTTGGGATCLYVAAANAAGESKRVAVPGDFTTP